MNNGSNLSRAGPGFVLFALLALVIGIVWMPTLGVLNASNDLVVAGIIGLPIVLTIGHIVLNGQLAFRSRFLRVLTRMFVVFGFTSAALYVLQTNDPSGGFGLIAMCAMAGIVAFAHYYYTGNVSLSGSPRGSPSNITPTSGSVTTSSFGVMLTSVYKSFVGSTGAVSQRRATLRLSG